MKITRFGHRTVSVPVQFPVISSVRQSKEILFVLLDVHTDEGIQGIAYCQAFHIQGAVAIRAMLNHLEWVVKELDPSNIENVWKKMWASIKLFGNGGLATFALSMVDMALWDLLGKRSGLPVYQLLGGDHRSLEAYASDGCWLGEPENVAREAEDFAQLGFRTIKMRLGRKDKTEDLRTLANIREAVGEQIEILGDVNQGWTREESLYMAPRLQEKGMGWLEEPIDAEDMEGYRELSDTMSLPVTHGENLYGIRSFERFLKNNAKAIYTPDLQRIGGISGWRRIDSLFESYHTHFSLHLFPEFSVHLLAAASNPGRLEWMSWATALFQEPLSCCEGKVQPPQGPGFGMNWDEERIRAYEVG